MDSNICEESIYNLIPKPKHAIIKKPMYRSKYDPKSPLVGSTFGLHGTTVTVGRGVGEIKKTRTVSSTFGPSQRSDSTPKNYLKKGSGNPISPKNASQGGFIRNHPDIRPKEPVPNRNEMPIMGLKTSKNFIKNNAVEAILSRAKLKNIEEVNYLQKPNYGKVPSYLAQVNEEVKREKEVIEGLVKENMKESTCAGNTDIKMNENEREALINKLKGRWDEVNKTYEKICHRTNNTTFGDIKRKEAQEADLKQLEDDIELLSRPGPIFIRSD